MSIKSAGIWMAALSLGFAAIPAAIIGSAKGTDGLMLIGPAIIALMFAAVASAYVSGLTFIPPLWKGEPDEVGPLFIRSVTVAILVLAFVAMIGGAVMIIPAVAGTISGM